jgi:hypothetical protein
MFTERKTLPNREKQLPPIVFRFGVEVGELYIGIDEDTINGVTGELTVKDEGFPTPEFGATCPFFVKVYPSSAVFVPGPENSPPDAHSFTTLLPL